MTTSPQTRQITEETSNQLWKELLGQGISLLSQVPSPGLSSYTTARVDSLLTLCHVLTFRLNTGSSLPLIGILGNADSGKSTLLGSVAGADISRVTPIPHQTLGPVLAAPFSPDEWLLDPSFLRPVVNTVESAAPGTTGLSGTPQSATVVPAWDKEEHPFIMMDLPDIGTIDSQEEHQVALRLIPWLDRIILMLTEETFAQADHEEISRALEALRPERARPELFVVLNRRHSRTRDAEFSSRFEKARAFWPHATLFTLPHLENQERFPLSLTQPLVAESSARVRRILQSALCNLAREVTEEVKTLSETRVEEKRSLEENIQRIIESDCRFNRSFFSDDFRKRLDAFSPWHDSFRRLLTLVKNEPRQDPPVIDLMSEGPVQRHLIRSTRKIHQRVAKHLDHFSRMNHTPEALVLPEFDEAKIFSSATELVRQTNLKARKDTEMLLESLQKDRRIKDPLLSTVATAASAMFLVDLVIPSIGTLGSITFSGILSALGLSGVITADLLRKIRSNRLHESFAQGMREILEQAVSEILESSALLSLFDLSDISSRLSRWTRDLPEV